MALYLIAHKVRGEPALDVAERCDSLGTPSDPGPWWIIPTSGHRAHPYQYWSLEDLCDSSDYPHERPICALDDMPPDLPDHYEVTADPGKGKIRDLVTLLGIKPKHVEGFVRRA